MSRAIGGVSRALFDSDLIATRLALFLAEACWTIMLFWPGDTFARPPYGLMGAVASETLWALAFGISSVFQLRIVVYAQCRAPWARAFAAWNALLWVGTVGLILASVYPPPAAIGGELALAVSALWIAVRPAILARGERICASTP